MLKTTLTAILLLGLLPLTVVPALPASWDGKLDLDNKQNVVASRLEGSWKVLDSVNVRLNGENSRGVKELTVKFDKAAVPDKILKELGNPRKDSPNPGLSLTIYAVGKVTVDKAEYPCCLTNIYGNPHLVFFRERDGDPFGDSESCNLMLARAKDVKNDLLFVGGDKNNQPFTAMERVPDEKQK